jgi:TolA-binding protein
MPPANGDMLGAMGRAVVAIAIVASLAARSYGQPAQEPQVFAAAKQVHADAQAREKLCPVGDQPCKAQLVPLFDTAARAYRDYLVRFDGAAHALEVRYYLADILYFKLGKLEEAGDAYMIVGKSKPIGQFHRDAIVNAVAAYEGARGKQASPIDDKERAAAELYAVTFAGGPDTVGIMFKLAQLELDRDKLDEALRRFLMIVTKYPSDPNAGPAGDRVLWILNKTQNYAAIETTARTLAKHPAFGAREHQERLERLVFQAIQKQGDVLADAQQYAKAAELYLRAAGDTKLPRDGAQATMNAGVMFEKAAMPDRATETYASISARYPTEPLAAKALFTAAILDEKLVHWERAADAFELVAERYLKDPVAADALYNAVMLRRVLGQRDRSLALSARYAKLFASRADVPIVVLNAARLRAETGDHVGAELAFVEFARAYRSNRLVLDAYLGAARAAIALAQPVRATEHLKSATDLAKAQPPGPTRNAALAEIQLLRGSLAAREADAVSLDVDPAQLVKALAKKSKLWLAADQSFTSVIGIGDPKWAIAALNESAALRDRFVQSIDKITPPSALTPDERAAFRKALEEFASASRNQAIAMYRAGYDKAVSLGIYSADTFAMRDALIRLGALPADREIRAEVGIRSPMPALVETIDPKPR